MSTELESRLRHDLDRMHEAVAKRDWTAADSWRRTQAKLVALLGDRGKEIRTESVAAWRKGRVSS